MRAVWLIILIVLGIIYYLYAKALKLCLFIGLGAIVGLVLALINVDPFIQLVCFALTFLISWLLLKDVDDLKGGIKILDNAAYELVGQVGVVSKDIIKNGVGEVVVLKNHWKAIDINKKGINKGEYVKVKDVKGDKLIVSMTNPKTKNKKTNKLKVVKDK